MDRYKKNRKNRLKFILELHADVTKNNKSVPNDINQDNNKIQAKTNKNIPEKEFNNKYFSRVRELEELEWKELWEIVKGQDYEKFDAKEDWESQFDGSGMRGWWD